MAFFCAGSTTKQKEKAGLSQTMKMYAMDQSLKGSDLYPKVWIWALFEARQEFESVSCCVWLLKSKVYIFLIRHMYIMQNKC